MWTGPTDSDRCVFRLADLQTQKQKLTRLISRYEEDVEYERQRAENMQQEIAKADRTRREVGSSSDPQSRPTGGGFICWPYSS